MIYAVYIAICLVAMEPRDCDPENAIDWVEAPEVQPSLSACMLHGMEYISGTTLVIPGKTYPKVYCIQK